MNVLISKNLGRYNFAGNEKSWCVTLSTPFGTVSETFPEEDEPATDGEMPSEVLALIEGRLDSYWISTGREKTKATIAGIREHMTDIDCAWLESKAVYHERLGVTFRARLGALREEQAEAGATP